MRTYDPILLLILGLCPLLAVSDTIAHALGLGITTMAVLTVSSVAAASVGKRMDAGLRFATSVAIVAAAVGCSALLMAAWFHGLHESLGIFLPLLMANVLIAWRTQESAVVSPLRAAVSGLRTGSAVAAVLLIQGVAREIVGRGSLLHDASLMFGRWAEPFSIQLFRPDMGFLLAMLPPGAFISLGLLVAAYNWLTANGSSVAIADTEKTSKNTENDIQKP